MCQEMIELRQQVQSQERTNSEGAAAGLARGDDAEVIEELRRDLDRKQKQMTVELASSAELQTALMKCEQQLADSRKDLESREDGSRQLENGWKQLKCEQQFAKVNFQAENNSLQEQSRFEEVRATQAFAEARVAENRCVSLGRKLEEAVEEGHQKAESFAAQYQIAKCLIDKLEAAIPPRHRIDEKLVENQALHERSEELQAMFERTHKQVQSLQEQTDKSHAELSEMLTEYSTQMRRNTPQGGKRLCRTPPGSPAAPAPGLDKVSVMLAAFAEDALSQVSEVEEKLEERERDCAQRESESEILVKKCEVHRDEMSEMRSKSEELLRREVEATAQCTELRTLAQQKAKGDEHMTLGQVNLISLFLVQDVAHTSAGFVAHEPPSICQQLGASSTLHLLCSVTLLHHLADARRRLACIPVLFATSRYRLFVPPFCGASMFRRFVLPPKSTLLS